MLQFCLGKNISCSVTKASHTAAKHSGRTIGLVSQKVETWRMMTRTDHSETEGMCGSLGCFWKYDTLVTSLLLPSRTCSALHLSSDAIPALCLPCMQRELESGSCWLCSQPGAHPSTGSSAWVRTPGKGSRRKCRACSHYKRWRYSFLFLSHGCHQIQVMK